MHTLSENLATLQNLKCPSLTPTQPMDVHTDQKTYLDVLLLQGSHYSLFSLAECTVLSPCMGAMRSTWGHTVPYTMLSDSIKMIVWSSCPSIFHLHLVKMPNFQPWNRVATCDLHPNYLPRTSVYMDLARSSQHQRAPFWEPTMVEKVFSVDNEYSVFKTTGSMAHKAIETVPNKST